MLKWEKREIIEITNVLGSAHEEIQTAIALSQFNVVKELLAACIDCAKSILYIVNENSIKAAVFRYISEIKIFKNAESLSELSTKLQEIISAVESLPIKKEVLFLPYSASMWDSMHTVYAAAAADENCEAFVVPIPYYNIIAATNTRGDTHYEIDRFPKNVPVTHYENYDFEKRCPDIIFIHNPYDYQNNITRVIERFYSSNLIKYTKTLIYIPYWVSLGYPDKNSVVVQGVINSEKVFVESEWMRKAYMDMLIANRAEIEAFFKIKCDNKYVEDKIVALGSPKLELAYKSKREDFDLPYDWLKKIRKADGTFKKVVLYNTSVSDMLAYSSAYKEKEGNDRYFLQLESVFEVFRSRDDIVIWWRPHPLFLDTVKSLRPIHYERLNNILSTFIAEDYGIYDTTGDINRAVAWSDVYFGDGSSVMLLFAAADKPYRGQHPRTAGLTPMYDNWYSRMDTYNGKLYCMSIYKNQIFEFDPCTGETRYFGFIPGLALYSQIRFNSVQIIDSKTYILTTNTEYIYVYDFITKTFDSIKLELKDDYIMEKQFNFQRVFPYKNKLFFFPNYYKSIICYDIETKKTSHLEKFSDIMNTENGETIGLDCYVFIDDHAILTPVLDAQKQTTMLLSVDLENMTVTADYNSMNRYQINYITKHNDRVYAKDGVDLSIHVLQGDDFDIYKTGTDSEELLSARYQTATVGKFLYVISKKRGFSYKLNLETGAYSEFHAFDDYYPLVGNEYQEMFIMQDNTVIGDKIYFSCGSNSVLEYDTSTEKVRELVIMPRISHEERIRIVNEFIDNFADGIKFAALDSWINGIVNLNCAGQAIFDYSMELND